MHKPLVVNLKYKAIKAHIFKLYKWSNSLELYLQLKRAIFVNVRNAFFFLNFVSSDLAASGIFTVSIFFTCSTPNCCSGIHFITEDFITSVLQ